jgi:hypothetical protein
MFLNIITPCSRPENLHLIAKSIKLPSYAYRWIVVFDSDEIPENTPMECETYAVKVEGSVFGNGQRNFAIDLVEEGYLYFNDDDTEMSDRLWENIKDLDEDFISFGQLNKDGTIRLEGKIVAVGYIDSNNFLINRECVGDTRWSLSRYDADGVFAYECYKKAKTKKYIPKTLSTYNSLK